MNVWPRDEHRFARTIARGAGRIVARSALVSGARRTIAWLQDEFFLGMVDELNDQEVPQRVAAGMFGLGHRTYLRRLAALRGAQAEPGSSLWWRVREALANEPMKREEVFARFSRDPQDVLASIVRDLEASGWVVEEHGRLTARADELEWSDERLQNYVNSRFTAQEDLDIETLVRETGVDEYRIRGIIDALGPVVTVEERPVGPMFWAVLSLYAEHSMALIHARVSGDDSPNAMVLKLTYDAGEQDHVATLREEFDAVMAGFAQTYSATTEEHVDGTHAEKIIVWSLCQTDQSEASWVDA